MNLTFHRKVHLRSNHYGYIGGIIPLQNAIVTYLLIHLPKLKTIDLNGCEFTNCDISLFLAIANHRSLLRVTIPSCYLGSTSIPPLPPNLDLSKVHIFDASIRNLDSQALIRECLSTGCGIERLGVEGVLAGQVPCPPQWTSWVYPGLKRVSLRGSLHCFSGDTVFDKFVSRHPCLTMITASADHGARLPQCDFPLTRLWCNGLGRLSYALMQLEISRIMSPAGDNSFECREATIHASALNEAGSDLLSLFISRVNESFPRLKVLKLRLNSEMGLGHFMESFEVLIYQCVQNSTSFRFNSI
jgi:hypothetical protein